MRREWLKRVGTVLKGADFEERLVSHTRDGIRVEPLYGATAGPRIDPARGGPWTVFQRIDHPDPARANAQALDDLAGGADGLTVVFDGAASARGFGIPHAALAARFESGAFHAIAIRLEGGPNGRSAAEAMARLARAMPVNPELLDISFGMDPIGVLATRGFLDEPWEERAKLIGATVKDLAQDFRGPFAMADGRVWHEMGASAALELGLVLATAIAYLRSFETVTAQEALARAVSVTLAADQDMFLTLAKFRAMRLLWERLLPGAALDLHGETSWPMMAALDPHVNILRACAGVFGAGLGGASSICVLPFSLPQGLPNHFARRVARNAQIVLQEEANLWRVDDPASGAGYVEHLTAEICEKAWGIYRDVEAIGGIAKAIESGWVRGQIKEPPRGPVIGVSAYRLEKEFEAAIERPSPLWGRWRAARRRVGSAGGTTPPPRLRRHLPHKGGGKWYLAHPRIHLR